MLRGGEERKRENNNNPIPPPPFHPFFRKFDENKHVIFLFFPFLFQGCDNGPVLPTRQEAEVSRFIPSEY